MHTTIINAVYELRIANSYACVLTFANRPYVYTCSRCSYVLSIGDVHAHMSTEVDFTKLRLYTYVQRLIDAYACA